jgi:hypothetical protein
MPAGGTLRPGQSLTSIGGRYQAVFQATDGNFVIYGPSGAIWATGTGNRGASFLVFQADGNFVMYNWLSQPIWASGSSSTHPGALSLGSDGNLVASNTTNQAIWSWRTGALFEPFFTAPVNATSVMTIGSVFTPGMALFSPNGDYMMVMQSDGNLVLYGPRGPLWSTLTRGPGSFLIFQPGDGNLVLYNEFDTPLWTTGTGDRGASFMVLQDDGNFVIYTASNTPLWASGT